MQRTEYNVSRLRAQRQIQHKSLAAVAGPAGISVSYLSKIETGRKRPSVAVLLAIANELGLTDLVANLELFAGQVDP